MASSNVCWGIDIGAGAIKALRLERDGDTAKVGDFIVVPHKRVLSTPDIVQADAIRVALGSFLGEYREQLRGASVVCSLPGHATFARFAKLPPVEGAKGVENLVKFEAVQQIPFPIEEVEWDYQVFASDDSPEVEVGIFAVTRERVNEKLSLWGEVGLNPDQITLGPVAAYNAIAYDLEFTEDSPGTVIVDIGTVATDLIIAERGRVWIRTFPIGGHHFTEVLAETFKLPYAKAEKLKREAETSKYKRHIFQALKPILTDLVQDVQRSISYYQETHPTTELGRVIGLGSTFKLLGLRKLMSQQLGMDVYRLEGFKRTTVEGSAAVEFDSVSINMATAYGLALQGLGMTPISANLVPSGVIRETLWRSKTPYFVTAAAIGLLGAASTFVGPILGGNQTGEFDRLPAVQEVQRTVSRLKNDWTEISEQHTLNFNPENADRLRIPDALEVHLEILADTRTLIAQATDADDNRLYRLFSFDTEYLAPGTALTAGSSSGGNAGGRSGAPGGNPFGGGRDESRGGSSGGADDGSGAAPVDNDTTAGALGAFRVTVELDTQEGEPQIFNDAILEWLKTEEHTHGRKYRIVGVPDISGVQLTPDLTPLTRGTGLPMQPPSSAPAGAGDGRGFGPTGGAPPGGDVRQPRGGGGAPGTAPRGRGGGGFAPGARGGGSSATGGAGSPSQGGDQSIDGVAPLDIPSDPFEGVESLYRYTVTFYVQRMDKVHAEQPEAPAGSNDINEDF